VGLGLVGCSSSGGEPSDPDAAVSAPIAVTTSSAVARAGAFGTFHRDLKLALVPNADGLKAIDAGFASKGFRTKDPSHMAAVFPSHADATVRLGAGRVEKWSLKLSPIGAAHVAAAEDEGRIAYENAWISTDLVVTSATRGVEWMMLLRDEKAPTTFTWKMELGADLHLDPVRLRDGSIDFVDGKGDAAIRIHPAFLVDAKGTKRDVQIDAIDGELRVSVDTSGLRYPILVDPVASVPIWQKLSGAAVGGLGNPRISAPMTWLSGSSTLLSIGGLVDTGVGMHSSTDVRQWNGSAWSAYPVLPAVRHSGAAGWAGSRAYVFGGCTDDACHTNLGSMLQTAGVTTGWTTLCASCGPSARMLPGLASVSGQLVLFGGQAWNAVGSRFDPLGDVWVMDAAGGGSSFSSVAAAPKPSGRYGMAFVGQPSGSTAMLFGGASGATFYGDTWLWTKTGATTGTFSCACSCSATSPPVGPCPEEPDPRRNPASAWDDNRQRFLVIGGYAQFGDGYALSRACHEFDPVKKSWNILCGEGPLDGCITLDMMEATSSGYDPVRRRVVVSGGQGGTGSDTFTLYVRGGSCSSNADCDTGYCVESTCCETSSCPICKSCATSGSPGQCANIPLGQPDTVNGCLACDGSGNCKKANGASCSAGTECASGNCVDSTCCVDSACGGGLTCASTNGTCRKSLASTCSSNLECASGKCTDGVCCTVNSCGIGSRCDWSGAGGTCKKNIGQACTAASDCGNGQCVDGYCCNAKCTGQCEACDVVPGACAPVTGAVHGKTRTACDAGIDPSCGASCNGSDTTACHYVGSSTSCGSASCSGGFATSVGTCTGSGKCDQVSTSCGNYVCGATACKTSCASDTDCATGNYCQTGSCVAKKAVGLACAGGNQCAGGNCVNGVCCGSSSCPSGSTCNGASNPGTCTNIIGQTCSLASECATNLCVDGVCCNSACAGQCQACNVTGSVGTCANVVGPPVGSRSACAGSGSCGARCDGTNPSACSYPGVSTSCGTASCSGGVATGAGSCDGSGSCNTTSTSCGAYVCGATACKTTCATTADCGSGYYCKSGACAAKEADGTSCTALGATSCASGNCVDGVCCGSASCAGGAKCNVAGAAGKCTKPNGIACSSSSECGSGFCVDGVCCDTSCSSQCAACDVSSKVGTCSAVTGTPHGTRSACGGAGAGTQCGSVCNGSDMIACHYPIGTTSCGANTCTSSGGSYIETHVSVCDGAGACKDDPKTCGGYLCGATSCKSSCTVSTDCNVGYYCKSNACIPIEGLGTSCTTAATCTSGFCTDGVCCALGSCGAGKSCSAGLTKGICASLDGTSCVADSECASGACVDGVCCDSKCDGSCEACNKTGSVGKCVPIVGNPLTGHAPCTGASTSADCAQRCDGTDGKACKYPGGTATCGTPSCGDTPATETEVSTCDGAGNCKLAKKACAPYVCGTTSCLSTCASNTDCIAGDYCKSGACVPAEGAGKACAADAECSTGHCTDGVCCSVASCGSGASCAAAGTATPGECLLTKGAACTSGDKCASGHCVDGVCCDTACGGQCEACALKGSEGTCTPVVGPPQGDRVACDTLDANDCKKQQCDGVIRDKCNGFKNGATTECGTDSCTTDKRFQKKGSCDGKGGCALPDPKPCTPYGCDAAASSGCKSNCATESDCADGYTCAEGKCIQGATCSEDKLSSVDKTGVATACTPYVCGSDGTCLKSCGSSDDCANGTICDTNVKACVGAAGSTDDGGGCSMGARGGSSFGLALAFLALFARLRKEAR
jgi:hypothetical protein